MKKLLALALVVFGLAACQTEPEGINVDANGEAAVTLNVALPDDATRAAGADSAKGAIGNVDMSKYDIRYILEIYDENGVLAKDRMVETSDATTAAFSFRLIPGRAYNFVVWADFVENGKETDLRYNTNEGNGGLRKVEVIKEQWDVIDESRDAYTGIRTVHNFSGSANVEPIILKRPFAKLRVVTNDIKEMISIRPAEVKVEYFNTKFYDTFDAYANTASGEYTGHALTATLLDSQKNPVDVYTGEEPEETGVQTLFADYFFGAADDRVMFTMDVKDNGGRDLPQVTFNTNIPVKRNMLTTVYGPVLTDSNNITVTIDPAFENGTNWNPGDDKYDVEVWDGKTLSAPKYNATDDVYEISTGSQLAYFAAAINGTLPSTLTRAEAVDYKAKTMVLTGDINLDFNEWTPIGNSTYSFQGTFDGQGHKIANLAINAVGKSNIGLFGFTTVGEIKNLVVENAKVVGRLNVGVVAGTPYTSKFNNITVQGHVEVNGMSYVGAVGGKNAYANWTNVTVNVDETSYVNANSVEDGVAYRTYVGGVCGFNGEGGHSFKNITSNIDVKGSTCDVGGLFGIAHYGNKFENCSCSGDVEIYAVEDAVDAQEIGGIAGVWYNKDGEPVTMTNCTFTGKLKTNIPDVDFYYGGLVGKPYSETGTGILWLNGNKCLANGIIEDENGNDAYFANNAEELTEALKEIPAGEAGTVNVTAGEYTFPTGLHEGVTINCAEGTVFKGSSNLNIGGATVIGADFVNENGSIHSSTINGNFKDCTFEGATVFRYCYAGNGTQSVFEDCYFKENGGEWLFHFDGGNGELICRRCTFDGKRVAIGSAVSHLVMEDCTFVNGSYFNTYCKSTISNSHFETSVRPLGNHVTFNNCTYYDEAVNIENLKLFSGYDCKVTIDDKDYAVVSQANNFTKYVKEAERDINVYMIAHILDQITILQKADVDVFIAGNGKTLRSVFIHGQARHNGAETLTFDNVHFSAFNTCDLISSDSTGSVERYAHNVTIQNCSFEGDDGVDVVGLRLRQAYNVTIKDCTTKKLHSLGQITSVNGLTIEGVTINGNSGLNLLTSCQNVNIKKTTINATEEDGYAIRMDAGNDNTVNVENSTLTAYEPIVFRSASAAFKFNLVGNNTINKTGDYHIVVKSGVSPTMTGVDGLDIKLP